MENLDNLLRELAAASTAQDQRFAAAAAHVSPAEIAKGLSWPIGARVLDLVTGVKGTVVDGKRENVVLPSA